MKGLSKCCEAWARPIVEWMGEDYKRTEDGFILIVGYQCQKCHKPCEVIDSNLSLKPSAAGRGKPPSREKLLIGSIVNPIFPLLFIHFIHSRRFYSPSWNELSAPR